MAPLIEIKPSPDGDGFCLRRGKANPMWFTHEQEAVVYAQEVFPTSEVVVYAGDEAIKQRYAASRSD